MALLFPVVLCNAAAVGGILLSLCLLVKMVMRSKSVSFAKDAKEKTATSTWQRMPTPAVLESWRRLATEEMDANHCAQAMEKGLYTEGIKRRFFELCPFTKPARQQSTNSLNSDTWEDIARQCEQTR
eukprot:TRINITY_DN73495_c0_g1_i1.p1 TRINITY_DN73495_c0_g1~~TRINITY_DN73495_c0_g1_i1.p1  ORF type:complete len:127 (+),score=25.03 TRINITY_DN73495_c0_g1_i1:48-428(+)